MRSDAQPVPRIFDVIGRAGDVSFPETHSVFPHGDRTVVFEPDDIAGISRARAKTGQRWYAIGNVRTGRRRTIVGPPPGRRSCFPGRTSLDERGRREHQDRFAG